MAIYRDNCKVAQPLSMAKKEIKPDELVAAVEAVVEVAPAQVVERIVEKVVKQPVRQKLPRNRRSRTFEFRVADCKGFVTVGEYDDGRPGELFLKVSKQGSTLAGILDSFAISVSYGLQYGVPLSAFVKKFTNVRFEPAGMTDDPDIRFATSLVDYIFRRLAVDYLPLEERMELGILSVGERLNPHPARHRGGRHGDFGRPRHPCRPSGSRHHLGRPGSPCPSHDGGAGPVGGGGPSHQPGRPLLHAVRGPDDPGGELPRLPLLWLHQRLLVRSDCLVLNPVLESG